MITKEGFLTGDPVEFQNSNRVWVRGTVQHVEWATHRIEGPGGQMIEKRPAQIHVLFHDSYQRKLRVLILPKKRVRAVKP